ncbi:MAG: hypothetical protein ACYDAJ_00100 [Nitrosotalea sp.]
MKDDKKAVKIDSFLGFALTGGDHGDTIQVGFQFNVNDELPPGSHCIMSQHILDDFIYPEVMRRIKAGDIESDFPLYMAQVLLFSNPVENHVLLNDEVRIQANVKFVEGKSFQNGESVKGEDIAEILGLYPSEKNNPNAAHIMLFKFKKEWRLSINLIYDREIVQNRFNTSQKYLKLIQDALNEENWSPFIDNLFTMTELTVQSILLLRYYNNYSLKQTHQETGKLFKGFCSMGNAPIEFFNNYESLWKLRKKARYLHGTHGKEFSMKTKDAIKHFTITKDMISYTNNLLKVIDLASKPKHGEYIVLGKM